MNSGWVKRDKMLPITFCDSKYDLQSINTVTIHNTAVPLFVNQFVKGMAACACYSMLNLYVGYNHCILDVSSCDLTTSQTPSAHTDAQSVRI